jgi:Mn2+/Fe2+ NRAMP family transporter
MRAGSRHPALHRLTSRYHHLTLPVLLADERGSGINAIAALFWTAVINGVLAPPLIILLMLVTNNRKIMGKRINNAGLNIIGWLTAALMLIAAVALFITL